MICSSVIICRREFGFRLTCGKFYGAKTRGPRLFCRINRKKVLGQKPTFSCRVRYDFGLIHNFVNKMLRPAGPVPTCVRPVVENSGQSTLDPTRGGDLVFGKHEFSQKMQVRGTVLHMVSLLSRVKILNLLKKFCRPSNCLDRVTIDLS